MDPDQLVSDKAADLDLPRFTKTVFNFVIILCTFEKIWLMESADQNPLFFSSKR